jgi:hypothetical protein
MTSATFPSRRRRTAWMVTMFGWSNRATVRASRAKRATASASEVNCGRMTLIAASRWSARSRARYTTAVPPRPISRTIS